MNAPTTPRNVVTGTEASSQPPSLAPSPVLDVDMAVVSSVSFGTSTCAAAGGSTTTTEMEVEDTAATETATPSNQQYLLHHTPSSPSTFNPALWTGQIIGSGGIGHPPAMMAQNQPTPTTTAAAAAAFSTPSLIRDGPPSVDADSNHLLRSATLYASPDLAALTAIATATTSTLTTTTNNDNAATPSTMTMMNAAAAAAAPTNDVAAASGYGLGYEYGYGYGFGYHGYYTPSAAAPHATANLPTTTIDGRIVGAATSRDDLPPTGTTPPLPTPLPMSAPRHLRHPGMFAGTPIGDGGAGISRSFFTPGGNFANLYAPSVEDTTDPAATATNMMGTSNPFGLSMANYVPGIGQQGQQQQQQQQQPRLNHPGAPFSLTVAAINASQMQVQPATGLQVAAMAAASANEPTISADAAKTMSDTVAAAAIAQIEAEMEAEKQRQEESAGAAAKKNTTTKKKRGGSAAGSKAEKPKPTRKPRPLPTASNRSAGSAAAAMTVPVGGGNTTGRYGSSRVSDGVSRPYTQEEKDATRCRCQKSKCLKLYCDCFQSGAECKDDCQCKSCGNTASNSKRQGIIDEILARKPEAFILPAAPKTDVGCRCKRSRCLMLYCACFKAGTDCGDACTCTDCANFSVGEDDDTKPAAEPAGTLEAAPAAPKPITPRDPEPAKAAENVDVTPDSIYRPVFSEHAAV